ncbi:MAG: energy-coupling factor transporter transmembrane component T [Raoultibacter sp.]
MKSTAFDTYHPLVAVAFFAAMLLFCMLAMQPVYIVLSGLGAFSYGVFLRGWSMSARGLLWQLPIVAVIALVNPLFSASGSTELFHIGLRVVYLESLVYGLCMGAMLVAVMLWFSNAAVVLSSDKVMAVLGNAAPTIALMISMIDRLVPQFVRRGREVEAVQTACLPTNAQTGREKMMDRLRLTSVMMGWSMEDSLETADAMRSRGWGIAKNRTTYRRYRFCLHDGVALVLLGVLAAFNAFLAQVACSQFQFYPTLSVLKLWWGYVPYAIFVFMPLLLQVEEEIRWMRS